MTLMFYILFLTANLFANSSDCLSNQPSEPLIIDNVQVTELEIRALSNRLENHRVPFRASLCLIKKYPELIILYRQVKDEKFNSRLSKFSNSNFVNDYYKKYIRELQLAWELYDDPFQALNAATQFNEILSNEKIIQILVERKTRLEIQNETNKQNDIQHKYIDEQKKLTYIENTRAKLIRKFYISKIIELGEDILKNQDMFIKKGLAESPEDFYKKVVIGCYEMNCKEKLKVLFNSKIKTDLNFSISKYASPLEFMIYFDRVDEVKILSNTSNFTIDLNSYENMINLHDSNIYNLLADRTTHFGSERAPGIDYNILADQSVSRKLTTHIQRYSKLENTKLYQMYFMNKKNIFKPNHILGYADFNLRGHYEVFEDAKLKKIAMPVQFNEIKYFAFDEPNWDSSKVMFNDDNKSLGLKRVEVHYEYDEVEFNEINNYWIGFQGKSKKLWVHSSQIYNIEFIDAFLKESLNFVASFSEVYITMNGTKIDKELASKLSPLVDITETKWIENDLWLNVNFKFNPCGEEDRDENKIEASNLWIKAFSKGVMNVHFSSRGC